MKNTTGYSLAVLALILVFLVGCQSSASTSLPVTQAPDENSASNEPSSPPITARQLVAPGALMGTGPSSFSWSPFGTTLAYVEPQDGHDVLWAFDPVTGDKRVLLDTGDNPDGIDLASAQWSPQGDVLLLAGATSLWLLDADTGALEIPCRG